MLVIPTLTLALQTALVCGNIASSQYDVNAVNYVVGPVQSFAVDDGRTVHTPHGFYGMPVNQYLDGGFQQQQQQQPSSSPSSQPHEQQAKVKKDIKEVNSGNTLLLDDIRNDLMGIKENLETLTTHQKNMDNIVNQKLAPIRNPFRAQPNLFDRFGQWPMSAAAPTQQQQQQPPQHHQIDVADNPTDSDEDVSNEDDELVSQYRREINYGNGAVYAAPGVAPSPQPSYGYSNGYDYSVVPNKQHDAPKKKIAGSGKKLVSALAKKRKLKDAADARRAARRANALQRHAQRTLAFIRNGVVNALWTALVVACVKLTPLLLYGAKLLFQSVIPLAGMAIFNNRRGLFADHDRAFDDHHIDEDDDVVDDDDHGDYDAKHHHHTKTTPYRHYSD